jgi:hypothetical protein
MVSIGVIIASFWHTKNVGKLIAQKTTVTKLLPKGVGMLLIVAHFSELLNAIEHVSIVHISIALFLLLAWQACTQGSESELY